MQERLIPRTMSTQHPDNASRPSWSNSDVIEGEAEVYEAYYAYKILGCQEVMWDSEGKDIDPHVVRKLLMSYPDFFKEKIIGRDIFLTYRIPNPSLENVEKKVFLETLQAIPRHYDVAKRFYGDDAYPPVFEVILPFTSSHKDILRVIRTYTEAVVNIENIKVDYPDITLAKLIGEMYPKSINVIPLLEEWNSILSIDSILFKLIEATSPKYLRVFLARSDPALYYGMVPAVILIKVSLSRLRRLIERERIDIFPILGCGSLPFRGHLSPSNLRNFLNEYRGIWTVTIQCGLKYDYPEVDTKNLIENLNRELPYKEIVDLSSYEDELITIAEKFRDEYNKFLIHACRTIERVSRLVPARRARRVHVGLFGYGRRIGDIQLPRAIPFTATFYSLGLPPEFIGFKAFKDLNVKQEEALSSTYLHMKSDLMFAAEFISLRNIEMMKELYEELNGFVDKEFIEYAIPMYLDDVKVAEELLGIRIGPRSYVAKKHENRINDFIMLLSEKNLQEAIETLVYSAKLRRSLG